MGRVINGFPELPSHTQTVVLGLSQFVVRFTFRERTGAWYLDLRTVDGQAIILGRRLSVDWLPLFGLSSDLAPDGVLFVRGPDGYVREDLGEDLLLIFYPLSELPAAAAEEQPTVVIAP
jgi:hypothetical protein